MTTAILPDVEALAIWWLSDVGITGGRVHGKFPTGPTYPLTVVHRGGGVAVDPRWLDRVSLQVDTWGDTQDEARDGSAAAFASLQDMAGFIDTGTVSGTVSGAEAGTGTRPFDDPDREKDRYTFTMLIYAHP